MALNDIFNQKAHDKEFDPHKFHKLLLTCIIHGLESNCDPKKVHRMSSAMVWNYTQLHLVA